MASYETSKLLNKLSASDIKKLEKDEQQDLEELKDLTDNFTIGPDEAGDAETVKYLDSSIADSIRFAEEEGLITIEKEQSGQSGGQKKQSGAKSGAQKKSSSSKKSSAKGSSSKKQSSSKSGKSQKQPRRDAKEYKSDRTPKKQPKKEPNVDSQNKDVTKAQADTIEHWVSMYQNNQAPQKITEAYKSGDTVYLRIYDKSRLFPKAVWQVSEDGNVTKGTKPSNAKEIMPESYFQQFYRTYNNQQDCGEAAEVLRDEGDSDAGGYLRNYCGDIEAKHMEKSTFMSAAHEKAKKIQKKDKVPYPVALAQALMTVKKK